MRTDHASGATLTPAPPVFQESIRLSDSAFAALVAESAAAPEVERRARPRHRPRAGCSMLLTLQHPGNSVSHFRIQPADISASGLGFFHRAFVYPGTRCLISARTQAGKTISLYGRVVRCRHVRGQIHDVGVCFEREAPVGDLTAGAAPADDADLDPVPGEDWRAAVMRLNVDLRHLLRSRAAPEAVRQQLALALERLTREIEAGVR